MGAESGIQWTDATWNPLVGCTKVSPGCDHCYAETLVDTRLVGTSSAFPNPFEIVTIREDRFLTQPLRWRKPKMVFVNSLSDLFHEAVPMDFIARVFAVMALAHHHTFQLLTKRHGRMRSLLNRGDFQRLVWSHTYALAPNWDDNENHPLIDGDGGLRWPLPNVWAGVSVEDQQRAELRVPALLDTPAAVRWVSAEPLLGPVDLSLWPGLSWTVVGGESGPGARPCALDWIEQIVAVESALGRPVFVKQTGAVLAKELRLKHFKGGEIDEWPDTIRVRQYPGELSEIAPRVAP